MKFNRLNKIFIILLIFIMSLFLCKIWAMGINYNENYKSEIVITDSSLSNDDIAYKLMDRYLGHYKSFSVQLGLRLKDYRINKVRANTNTSESLIKENVGSGFIFGVNFSFRPSLSESDIFFPGNGTKRDDGWIENEGREVIVVKVGDTYRIESIVTDL